MAPAGGLNWALAGVALVVWTTSYVWFFQRDLRRWWAQRHFRRARRDYERDMARQAYAAWVRNIPPPPPPRFAPLPGDLPQPEPPPPPATPPRPGGVVVPFPRGGRAGLPPKAPRASG